MAGEKIEKSELVDTGLQSEPSAKLDEQNMASGKDGMPSESASSVSSSGGATSTIKCETDQESVAKQGVYYPQSSYYNYYQGYSGASTQLDDAGYFHANNGSYTGVQSDNGSVIYYMPGYNPYSAGNHTGVDGQCVNQQPYFSSSGYLQRPVSYGSEAVPCYSWDSSFVGDVPNGTTPNLGNAKYDRGRTNSEKSNAMYSMKTNGTATATPEFSTLPSNSKPHQSRNFYQPILHNPPVRPSNKAPHLGSDLSGGLVRGFHPGMKFPSFQNQRHGPFPYNDTMNSRPNGGRFGNGYDRFKIREKSNGNGEFEGSNELTCGPRANSRSAVINSSGEKEELCFAVRRDQYNLQDFQTDYESAKFYVIKSFTEDNIHRGVKYGVWSSTPNGNKKLDAVFRDAESKAIESGKKCPIFLFFSVNGSGQFVGVAEMIGQVDFNKDMDFWQHDKWNGFFPVKWHMIKDIPNGQLRHIILEDNDNRAVTYTRDTQEIPLKQGIEMLKIFKNYSEKTTILDDFKFYENREKSNLVKKSSKPASAEMGIYQNDDFAQQYKAGERKVDDDSARKNQSSYQTASLIGLTRNLSLNSCPSKTVAAAPNPREQPQ